jgi:hypothetical protein
LGLWPIQGDEKRLGPATTLYATIALSFVLPSSQLAEASRERNDQTPVRATEARVPHISLVFREMWDTTVRDAQLDRCRQERSRGICSSADLSWKRAAFASHTLKKARRRHQVPHEIGGAQRSTVSFWILIGLRNQAQHFTKPVKLNERQCTPTDYPR